MEVSVDLVCQPRTEISFRNNRNKQKKCEEKTMQDAVLNREARLGNKRQMPREELKMMNHQRELSFQRQPLAYAWLT